MKIGSKSFLSSYDAIMSPEFPAFFRFAKLKPVLKVAPKSKG